MIIDYSSYSLWQFCPWAWFERYVNARQTCYSGQRDDALCLGSLVHNGLDNYAKHGKPFIDDSTIGENDPTPECLNIARMMVEGYVMKYPGELWPVELAEQPVQFSLRTGCATWACSKCGHTGGCSTPDFIDMVPELCTQCGTKNTVSVHNEPIRGLAKLDGYFYVPTDTTIESGLPDETLTLSRGWWSKEYKTKSPGVDRPKWALEWQTKRQADFQMLALQHLLEDTLGSPTIEKLNDRYGVITRDVQGILVCVLEKPREYTPKRKCKGCGETWELASYLTSEAGHRCPSCNHPQELKPYIPKVPARPEFYRMTVTRTPEQLAIARDEITRTALAMEDMRQRGMESILPIRENCVNNKFRRVCEYQAVHTYGGSTATDPRFHQIDPTKYMGLVV